MKHDLLLPAKMPDPSPVVTLMPRGGPLQLDPQPLTDIYAKMGDVAAENTVVRTLEDLAIRLNGLHDLRAICAFADMVRPAERLAGVADQVGLVEVSSAARHVANCAALAEGVALEATLARLERAYDRAIAEIWDFRAI